ncbi:MAG TPA: SET domain-containing protein-lysine N-methyltransferase [Pyrinomonadaceae bacterium]|nr:SET domain-containing protein-lysine N-methyltransferase [Pyrinomonadaceae bacterium]
MMRLRLAHGLAVRESPIDGRGCFATAFFPKGRKIAEYAGERITRREAARRMKRRRKHRVVYVDARTYLDGARGGNGTHYINHCCEPNSYMRVTRGHILFMALRDIQPGEEITMDYVTTYHSDRKRCRCRAATCRGKLNKQ